MIINRQTLLSLAPTKGKRKPDTSFQLPDGTTP